MTRGRTSAPPPTRPEDDERVDADRAASVMGTEPADHDASRAEDRDPDWSPLDIVEEWGFQSFPASDAPANW